MVCNRELNMFGSIDDPFEGTVQMKSSEKATNVPLLNPREGHSCGNLLWYVVNSAVIRSDRNCSDGFL